MALTRRSFFLTAPIVLSGCATYPQPETAKQGTNIDPAYVSLYGAIETEPFSIPAVDLTQVDPQFLRREIDFPTSEQAGTIVVDPAARYAYLVMERGRAIRYGVGVGKEEAFNFQGLATIGRKAEWPHWTPTPDMIRRDPERYASYANGLPGGPGNPLGPRALYLYRDNRDTLFRLHGTVEPWTIGTMVSSGCIRFLNQDIIDLYQRAPVGTRVVVLSATAAAS